MDGLPRRDPGLLMQLGLDQSVSNVLFFFYFFFGDVCIKNVMV
jgi:hypothetical protein